MGHPYGEHSVIFEGLAQRAFKGSLKGSGWDHCGYLMVGWCGDHYGGLKGGPSRPYVSLP